MRNGMSKRDTMLLETETLGVWIRRPSQNHRNWWLAYCSSDRAEALAWDCAIEEVCSDLEMGPFHQGSRPCIDHQCGEMTHYQCPDTVQAWELWMGCSEISLAFPDDPIEDIRACGDPALDRLFEAFEEIRDEAERLTKAFR
jgi:hypothetical protein